MIYRSSQAQCPFRVQNSRSIREKVSLSDARMRILDSSLRAEGVLHDYQEGLQHIDFTFQADIGSKIMEWVWGAGRLAGKV